ncbi:unnamed protein product [Ranitomeya imitator]|uniref:VWFA domain-containing protein n=1 Tax=Ranitomeya imitator TaxID=111125 RepID=A0ABN9LTP7_9NEOB|nr:unnamed protein product [Ranitomeya imitator]
MLRLYSFIVRDSPMQVYGCDKLGHHTDHLSRIHESVFKTGVFSMGREQTVGEVLVFHAPPRYMKIGGPGQTPSVTVTLPELPISQIPYTLSLTAKFQSAYGIVKIESSCDITPLKYTNDDKTEAEAIFDKFSMNITLLSPFSPQVSLSEGHKFDRDVQLLAYYSEVNKPSVAMENGISDAEAGSIMGDSIVMLNFYPGFPETQEQSVCGEFIFVVDRSGSMECPMNSEPNAPQRIQSAKETLVLLLKSLPLGCYFNIYGFGSNFESFFSESVEYTQNSLDDAVEKVNQMQADFGGTEILEPLQKIYKTAGRPDHPRQLFIFTDGEVGNTKQVITEVQRNAHSHRCFTFGIGEGASTALIKGVSRVANGTYDFITGKDRLQPKVLKALKCALQTTVKDVSIKWTLPPNVEVNLISQTPMAIFRGQRSIIYAVLKGKLKEEDEVQVYKDEIFTNQLKFSLKANVKERAERYACAGAPIQGAKKKQEGGVARRWEVPDLQHPSDQTVPPVTVYETQNPLSAYTFVIQSRLPLYRPTIHRLAAKNLISQLESDPDSEEVKKRILETSLQSGVISSLTAFVAVNKDSKAPVETSPVHRFNPPVAMAYGMSHPRGVAYCAPVPMFCCAMADPTLELADCGALSVIESLTMESEEQAPDDSPEKLETPALFRLISLQNADGSWKPSAELASILATSGDFLESCPDKALFFNEYEEQGRNEGGEDLDPSVWATILALVWLHSSCLEQRDEWELLESKAIALVKAKAGSSLGDSIKAANELLKSSVDLKVFG